MAGGGAARLLPDERQDLAPLPARVTKGGRGAGCPVRRACGIAQKDHCPAKATQRNCSTSALGNTLPDGTGASLAGLMACMGHGSTRAAMIYQHATAERDKSIAGALSASIAKERDRARSGHVRKGKV